MSLLVLKESSDLGSLSFILICADNLSNFPYILFTLLFLFPDSSHSLGFAQ